MSIVNTSAATPKISLSRVGTCCECTLLSRKLRICIVCAVQAGLMKYDDEKREFVLNTENKNAEQAFHEAKKTAVCGDCAQDGPIHEGHINMPLTDLANALEEKK